MPLNRVPDADASYECSCGCGCLTRARRYPTDLTDAEWAVLEPLLPAMLCTTELGGRPELHFRRTMIDAVFYLADNGIKWRAMPADFPPWRTVWGMCARWRKDGVLARIVDGLRAVVRRAAGRDPEPSAGIVDAQSVHESAEGVVPAATSGYDSHKNVNGRKRHVVVDRARGRGRLALVWADKAYDGDWRHWARRDLGVAIEVVLQPARQQGFQVLPRRWVVERTHAWITRRRRCARDYERLPAHHAAMVQWAAIIQMTRRAAKPPNTAPAPP